MTDLAAPEEWWVIITESGRPLVYGAGNAVLFPSPEEAERWMASSDRTIEL